MTLRKLGKALKNLCPDAAVRIERNSDECQLFFQEMGFKLEGTGADARFYLWRTRWEDQGSTHFEESLASLIVGKIQRFRENTSVPRELNEEPFQQWWTKWGKTRAEFYREIKDDGFRALIQQGERLSLQVGGRTVSDRQINFKLLAEWEVKMSWNGKMMIRKDAHKSTSEHLREEIASARMALQPLFLPENWMAEAIPPRAK